MNSKMNQEFPTQYDQSHLEVPGQPVEQRQLVAGIELTFNHTGARLVWSKNYTSLKLNLDLFSDQAEAQRVAWQQIAYFQGLKQAAVNNQTLLVSVTKKYPTQTESVLRWQGLALLKKKNQLPSKEGLAKPSNATAEQEFRWALEQYAATGSYPAELSVAVQQAIERIPRSGGQSVVDYILSGRYFKFDSENVVLHLEPLFNELAAFDQETSKLAQYDYEPSLESDSKPKPEQLAESDITEWVTPFNQGYYRKRVGQFDLATHRFIQAETTATSWRINEPTAEHSAWETRKTYHGIFYPDHDLLLSLPYNALPILSSVQPVGKISFRRSKEGLIKLEPLNSSFLEGGLRFSFDFITLPNESNQLRDTPTQKDGLIVGGTLDQETQQLLDDLITQDQLTPVQKAQEVRAYLLNKLRYFSNDEEMQEMDSTYLKASDQLWFRIMEHKVVDCFWSNAFFVELCHRIGVKARMVEGSYIRDKQPSFEFGVISANGSDLHAWTEVWDSVSSRWVHEEMDATPPRQQNTSNDQQPSYRPDLPSFDSTAIQTMLEQISESSSQPVHASSTPEEIAKQLFMREKELTYQDWERLKKWIEKVNDTTVPAEMSLSRRPTTIYYEWRDLYDQIVAKRAVPRTIYKGEVRQSEGVSLVNPVAAYLDLKSGNDDPIGFDLEQKTTVEVNDATSFDDDFILDVSGSMKGEPGEEQRKMVMSSEFNLMNFNQRLKLAHERGELREPLAVRSHVAVFGNWPTTVQESDQAITEKSLMAMNAQLEALNQGSTGLINALRTYATSLEKELVEKIKAGKYLKVLTIVSDGQVSEKEECKKVIAYLRDLGVVVQGIGFGSTAVDILDVCHNPADPDAAVVINDVRQATLTRHRLLMKHLSKV